ncbi:acyltransferase family protein [Oribacterium sp. WCC10]|uniref:acyltransferase family protein n=1 Tax=Oribacterium sp. WCC10 TaxID=1855343 RepID=UPI0008E95432|nr:acyltransferase [Oribacterium sp. WCC10]SFG12833.1 Peptidoglycan/LPS O-acetylase OafA/YrhL, contains acyltransferase and SGNH-hydrolase domains [Oribacterium sp. WCC10]
MKDIDVKKKKERDPGIDLVRVVACLLVIGTHVDVMGTGDATKLFIRLLFSDGVALFFILSGFFFFRKGFAETLKRSIRSIVIPGLVVMFLSYQFAPFIRTEQTFIYCLTHFSIGICNFLSDVFSWGGNIRESVASHLWYIFTYLQLVLAYPLLKPLYTKVMIDGDQVDIYRRYRWFIIGFIFLNQIVMDLNMTGLISFLPVYIAPFMLYTAPAMLLMIGAEISWLKDYLSDSKNRKIVLMVSLTVLIVVFAVRFMFQRLVFSLNQTQDFYLYWNCAFATVQSTAFIVLISCFDFHTGKVAGCIARVGRYTFWIYLVHYAIYYMIYYRKGPDWNFGFIDITSGYDTMMKEIMHLLIRIPTVFVLSLAVSFIITNIPGLIKRRKR